MAKICLDAGHYGTYNRSPAIEEYTEAERMWSLHLLLGKELEKTGVANQISLLQLFGNIIQIIICGDGDSHTVRWLSKSHHIGTENPQ